MFNFSSDLEWLHRYLQFIQSFLQHDNDVITSTQRRIIHGNIATSLWDVDESHLLHGNAVDETRPSSRLSHSSKSTLSLATSKFIFVPTLKSLAMRKLLQKQRHLKPPMLLPFLLTHLLPSHLLDFFLARLGPLQLAYWEDRKGWAEDTASLWAFHALSALKAAGPIFKQSELDADLVAQYGEDVVLLVTIRYSQSMPMTWKELHDYVVQKHQERLQKAGNKLRAMYDDAEAEKASRKAQLTPFIAPKNRGIHLFAGASKGTLMLRKAYEETRTPMKRAGASSSSTSFSEVAPKRTHLEKKPIKVEFQAPLDLFSRSSRSFQRGP